MNVDLTKKFVTDNGIEAEFIEHADVDATTSAGAATANAENLSRIIKVLCFVDKRSKCFAIVQGHKRVNSKNLGLDKPRLARAEELKEWFDAEPGGVPPIGLPAEIPKIVDEDILQQPYVIGSGGSKFVGLKLNPKTILSQPNTTVRKISE